MGELINHEDYGKEQVLGLELQFSKMLGDVVVENYIKNISEDDMKLIIDHMTSDLFEEVRDWNSADSDAKIKRIKEDFKSESNHSYYGKTVSVGNQIKAMFNEKVKEELRAKIEEIIKTTDYQEKIEMMAQDIVDYAIEGYKEDLKQSIREKMIGNVLSNSQSYGGVDLMYVINQAIDERMRIYG